MIIYSNIQPIKATKAGLRRQPKYPKITATIVMCIFANLNTITRGLSYRVGHLQQYYEVLLVCQQTMHTIFLYVIQLYQKLPSVSCSINKSQIVREKFIRLHFPSRIYSQVYGLATHILSERPQHGKLRNNLLSYSRYRQDFPISIMDYISL